MSTTRPSMSSAGWAAPRLALAASATYPKPTIAMVNGYCFGGGFTPLFACDLALAADEAVFGLSEVNWGFPPGAWSAAGSTRPLASGRRSATS